MTETILAGLVVAFAAGTLDNGLLAWRGLAIAKNELKHLARDVAEIKRDLARLLFHLLGKDGQ